MIVIHIRMYFQYVFRSFDRYYKISASTVRYSTVQTFQVSSTVPGTSILPCYYTTIQDCTSIFFYTQKIQLIRHTHTHKYVQYYIIASKYTNPSPFPKNLNYYKKIEIKLTFHIDYFSVSLILFLLLTFITNMNCINKKIKLN